MTSSKLHQHNDLASLDICAFANQGAWLVVRHPTTGQPLVDAEGKEWELLLAGKDSAVYRKATSEAVQRRFADTKERLSPEDFEAEQIIVLTACVLDWKNIVNNGSAWAYSADNAADLVGRFPWIREQIEAFVLSRERYFLANTPV